MRLKKWRDNAAQAVILEISPAHADCDQELCIYSPWWIVSDTGMFMHGVSMVAALSIDIMKIIMLFPQSYFSAVKPLRWWVRKKVCNV